jgi:hypothetical protein
LSRPMGKKAPKAPDPMQVAGQQQQFNTQAAQQNNEFLKGAYNTNVAAAGTKNPFSHGGYDIDPNTGMPTGFSRGFSESIQGGFDNVAGAFGQTTGLLPNFDMMTPQNIAMGNYGAYSAMTAPQREQMQNQLKTTMSERGIPEFSQNGDFGSDIAKNAWGNLNQQFALADTNAAAQAWNAVPGMQAQMTNTELQQKYAPANQNLAQLQGLYGLLPNINQPQLGAAQAGNVDYTGLVNNNYNQQMAQYNANQAALGGLFGGAAKWAMSPATPGGFAATNLGKMFS